MWKVICVSVVSLVLTDVQATTCALPSANPGEPYVALTNSSKREFSLLLDEYMSVHRWTQHSEAVSAGFRYGDRVYGDVLKRGGRFKAEKTAAWRRGYTKAGAGRSQFRAEFGSKVDMAPVDSAVVDWVLHVCLARKTWSEVRVIDGCRFVFAAGLQLDDWAGAPNDSSKVVVQPVRFEVRGGRCGRWPRRPLSEKGDAVECVRSGDAAVDLELNTDWAGEARQTLAPLPATAVPPEPVQRSKLTEPVSEVISLWRSRDYRLQQLGRGCPTCALYSADIRPSGPAAVILRAETVSSNGAGWRPCPAGLRCGVYEFSPPDNPRLSGCAGLPVCRVWRLAETEAEGSDVIQLTFQKPEVVCVNCPDNVDFETAHRQWEAMRGRARARCEVFAGSPAQLFKPAPTH